MKIFTPALGVVMAVYTFGLPNPAFAIPYCSSTEQVNCAKYGIGGKDCHQTLSEGRTQCIDVSDRGMEIILRMENRDQQNQPQEQCPQGYQQSERKCTNEERRRGCKDMRLKNGIGCVRR